MSPDERRTKMTRNANAPSCAETPQNPPPECQEWKGRYIWVDTEPTYDLPDSEIPLEAPRRRRGPGRAGQRRGSVSPAREKKEKKEKKKQQQRDETPPVFPQTKEDTPPGSPQPKEETLPESPQTKEEPPKSPQTSPSSSPPPSGRGDQEGPQEECDPDPDPDPDPNSFQERVKRFFQVLCEAMKGIVEFLGLLAKALLGIKEIVTISKEFSKMF